MGLRLVDLFEREGYTTLYRGDTTQIRKFILDKTHAEGLVGQGIYLTDSSTVAKDYTIKGNNDDIMMSDRDDGDLDPREFLVRRFYSSMKDEGQKIAKAYSMAITDIEYSITTKFQHEIDTTIGTGRDARQHPRYNELVNWRRNAEAYTKSYIWKASWSGFEAVVRELFMKRYAEFKKKMAGTRMMKTVIGQVVIMRPEQAGYLSEFEVPKRDLQMTFRIDDPMENDVIRWIMSYVKSTLNYDIENLPADLRYNHPVKGEDRAKNFPDWVHQFSTHGMRFAWNEYDVGGNGENPTMMEFTMGTHYGHSLSSRNDGQFWKDFRTFLESRGYIGIHYNGGTRTGSSSWTGGSPTLHNAYCFWDEDRVHKWKTSNKQLGLDGTDPRLYSRFRLDRFLGGYKTYYDHHTDQLGVGKNLPNREAIEAEVNRFVSNGYFSKALAGAGNEAA